MFKNSYWFTFKNQLKLETKLDNQELLLYIGYSLMLFSPLRGLTNSLYLLLGFLIPLGFIFYSIKKLRDSPCYLTQRIQSFILYIFFPLTIIIIGFHLYLSSYYYMLIHIIIYDLTLFISFVITSKMNKRK